MTPAQYKQALDILMHTEGYPDWEWEKEGCRQYCLGEAEWNYINHHRRHCNGPKRKRDARLARRIRMLERMDRFEHTISRLLEGQIDGSVSRNFYT